YRKTPKPVKMMKKFVTLLFVLVFIVGGYAQNNESNQLNIKVKDDWEGFKTISCKEDGFISYYLNSSNDKLTVSFYDKELNKAWEESVHVDDDLIYIDHIYNEMSGKVYLLFALSYDYSDKYTFRYQRDCKIELITIKTDSKIQGHQKALNKVSHNISIPTKNAYKNMLVSNNQLFLFLEKRKIQLIVRCCMPGHTFQAIFKDQPNYFTFMLNTEKDNVNKGIEITKDKAHYYRNAFQAENGDINYYLTIRESKKKGTGLESVKEGPTKLYRLDGKNGNIKHKVTLSYKERGALASSQAVRNGDQIILSGFVIDESTRAQTGMKFRYIEDGEKQKVNKLSLKEAIGRDKENPTKSNIWLGTRVNNISLLFHNKTYQLNPDGDYVIIAERLWPEYVSSTDGKVTRIDGYTYKEAYVMAFDKDHNFMWHETFDMGETRFYNTKKFTRLVVKKVAEDKLQLLFGSEDAISSLIINDEGASGKQRDLRLTSKFRKKRIRSISEINVKYWYGDYFLATGFLDVKKSDSFLSGSDEMYYVYPIKFE
ncbi:MAG: hypothetical protein K9I29_00740, partial [Bacteroidales bacterium]|nr:hypothetical protein [Bacteroidales bacterium]